MGNIPQVFNNVYEVKNNGDLQGSKLGYFLDFM